MNNSRENHTILTENSNIKGSRLLSTEKLILGCSILLLLLIFRLWFGSGSYTHIEQMQKQIAQQQKENAEKQKENDKLQAEIEDFKAGNDIIESRARSELGFIRKGETFYQIVLKPEPPKQQPEANNPHNKSIHIKEKVYE